MFAARFRLGMFDDDCEYDAIPYDVVECEAHTKLNLQMAEESIVLLKNDGILPLSPNQNIAVIGPVADDVTITARPPAIQHCSPAFKARQRARFIMPAAAICLTTRRTVGWSAPCAKPLSRRGMQT